MESTRKIRQDRSFLKIFTFWSTFVQKSTFGNWTFAQFLSFEWRNGSQNRNVLEKLSRTGLFWKFWLFGQGQGSTWSKHFFFFHPFFFFFWGGSDRVRMRVGPGQTRSDLSGWWRHGWRHCFGRVCTCGTCVLWRLRYGACARVRFDGGAWEGRSLGQWTADLPVARGGDFGPEIFRFCLSKAVEDHGFVILRNHGQICTDLR